MQRTLRNGYLSRALRAGGSDPRGAFERLRGGVEKRRDRRAWERLGVAPDELYGVEPDWEREMHAMLGIEWPCLAAAEFGEAWGEAQRELRAGSAPQAQSEWLERAFDAVPSLAGATWCVTRHLRPKRIVETGVARGITSRFLLAALERNEDGHLWSIDLPHPDTLLNDQIGAAVPERLRDRWTLSLGSSTALLPRLLDELGEIDLFVHDSLHTTRNVDFELTAAWEALRPGGAILVDDIHWNLGFQAFRERTGGIPSLAAPRSSDGGLWGLAIKP